MLNDNKKKQFKKVLKRMKKENKLVSKCCKAEVDYVGGGYDGEDIVSVTEMCKKCLEPCERIYARVGRPYKVDLPF